MTLGLIGEKCGMTRIFTKEGESLPVSVIKIDMNRVVQMKNLENDGYNAVQITRGQKKPTRLNKALAGHYAKNNVAAFDYPKSPRHCHQNECVNHLRDAHHV